MENIFLKVLNLSLTASWIVLAVIILRLLLKKAPKWINCLLWGIVALRLILPFSFESVFSLLPTAEPIPQNIATMREPAIDSGLGIVNNAINPIVSYSFSPNPMDSANPLQIILPIASIIWIIGILTLLIYGAISYIRLKIRVSPSILHKDNIYYCDNVSTPFIFGIVKPKIYLPSGTDENHIDYIISHEKAHLKRLDHIAKPLGFLLLACYWFNPFMWLSYILFCRDIESACDQKVIKDMNNQSKKNYLEALVSCSVHKRVVLSCPLAFGEVGVKGRVKSVVNYKKPAFWITIVAVITCLAVALSFLTTPKTDKVDTLKSDSELEGLSVEVVSFNGDNIEIKWTNDTENEIIYGEEFYIYKQIGGGWDNCRTLKEYAWNTIAYIIKPNSSSTHKYSLDSISMVDNGNYRFESNCFIDGKSDQKYTVWVQFEIKNGTVDALSMNDGKVFFYSEPTDEHETPVIKKHADFGNEFDSFLKILKNKKWVNDNFVDRLAFNYDGKIFYGGNWIYFGYEHKVIYYDHYFCDADDDVIKTIKKIEEKAVDYTYTEKTNQNPYFNATVLEVYDNSVLVEPFSDEEIRKTSDQIYVGTDVISTNPVPNLKKGMQIRVVYNGNILESYPAVINGVFAIYELDKDGEVIFIEDIVRHIFDPVEICYSNGMYSYIASVESLPTYEIINNMELYEMYFNGPHNLHGEMTKIKLTKEKFDLRFSTDMWDKAASIRQNNKNAWEIYSPFKAGDTPLLYLLLEQNDGTFYLGYGYYNIGSNNPVTSDDSQIRFVYKLKQVENLQQANPKW